jgi:superfamily II DNA or RNA helicase
MTAALLDRWPSQLYALEEVPARLRAGYRRVLVTSPTGGGKTVIICDLILWALKNGYKVIVYSNRKLLVRQLARVLRAHGITFGVRAAGHKDQRELPVQVSSLPTENSRVLRSGKWQVHGHGERVLAIVDEAHLNAGPKALAILTRHLEHGGAYVGFTATPIDLAHAYDTLIVAGTPSELRKCGALVHALHYGPDEPDMKAFKQDAKTGEFTEEDVGTAIMTKTIFGRVLDHYRLLNPEQRPTILFAPGVRESIWFAEELTAAGGRAAHIDSNGVWLDGEYSRDTDRDYVLTALRRGEIQVLCNRFVAREGLDLPEVSHIILATVMGSLRTYLQSVGRGLRAAQGKKWLTIQDHGGHWHRHGSVNVDRAWELNLTETGIREARVKAFRE